MYARLLAVLLRLCFDQQPRPTDHDAPAMDAGLRSATRQSLEARRVQVGKPTSLGFGHDNFGEQDVPSLASTAAAQRTGRPRCRLAHHYARKCGGAARERSGLVENHHIQIARPFERELSLTRRPFCAPSEVEMAITSGIARPRACGQAIMRTVAVRMRACSLSPASHQ